MEVRHGQEFCLALGEPFSGGAALALGAVTIATRIISDVDVCALLAECDVLSARILFDGVSGDFDHGY
jgi:hypothetical protein